MRKILVLLKSGFLLLIRSPRKIFDIVNIYNIKRLVSALRDEESDVVFSNASNFLKNVTPIRIQLKSEPTSHELEIVNSFIDEDYYERHYGVSERAGAHYCSQGWKKGFNPSDEFKTNYYLEYNPDVKSAAINPFYHYICQGKIEGRHPSMPGGVKRYELLKSSSIKSIEQNWRIKSPTKTTTLMLFTKMLENVGSDLIVSISHDFFKSNSGGVQLCIGIEYELSLSTRKTYLHISPLSPLLSLQMSNKGKFYLHVLIGEEEPMILDSETLLAGLNNTGTIDMLIVHSILGFRNEFLRNLFDRLKSRQTFFWIHDFSSSCVNFNLMRNGITFCNAPSLSSSGCSICVDHQDRVVFLAAIRELLQLRKFTFLFPSASAKNVFRRTYPESKGELRIHPHLLLDSVETKEYKRADKIKIAFCGSPMYIKGWNYYIEFMDMFHKQYEFYHFATIRQPGLSIKHVKSEVKDGVSNMTENLILNKIDFVFIGSVCSETFSFSTHEAISAGCFVLNIGIHGNVPDMLNNNSDLGKNYTSLEELIVDCKSGFLDDTIQNWTRKGRNFRKYTYSKFSLDFLEN